MTSTSTDPVADYLSQHAPQSDDPVAKYLGTYQPQAQAQASPWDAMKHILTVNTSRMLGSALGPVGEGLANTVAGGDYSPADIMAHGFTQGLDEKTIAAAKGVAASVSGKGGFGDTYRSALGELVARREAGEDQFGTAGKALGIVSGALPYVAGGGMVSGPTSVLGKLATSTAVGAGGAALNAAAVAPPGQEASAAGKASIYGGAIGLGTGVAGLAAASLWRRLAGPQNPEQAGIEWLKKTGAFGGDIADLEDQLNRRVAKLPPEMQGVPVLGQLGEEKLTRDALSKMARSSPSALKTFTKAADEHGAMADPFYAKSLPQPTTLTDAQAAILTNEPAAISAWGKAARQFGELPPPQPGTQVPVQVMDFVKRDLDKAVGGTREYVARDNLRLLRDALIAPVKAGSPDYAKATALSSVEQSFRAAILAGQKAQNTAAVKGGILWPNPVPEATVGMFLHLIHGNPMYAAGIYALRAAANISRRATGIALDRTMGNAAQLLVEPALTALPKLAAPVVAPSTSAALPAGAGGFGGALGAVLSREQ